MNGATCIKAAKPPTHTHMQSDVVGFRLGNAHNFNQIEYFLQVQSENEHDIECNVNGMKKCSEGMTK